VRLEVIFWSEFNAKVAKGDPQNRRLVQNGFISGGTFENEMRPLNNHPLCVILSRRGR